MAGRKFVFTTQAQTRFPPLCSSLAGANARGVSARTHHELPYIEAIIGGYLAFQQSKRECEAKLFEISPQALPTERERVVSAAQDREIRLVISPELHEKLHRIRGLIAHSQPNATYAELLEYLVEETLPGLEKKKGLIQGDLADQKTQVTIAAAADPTDQNAPARDNKIIEKAQSLPKGKRVYLPAALKRAVYARSGGRCEYTTHGKRCSSRYMLEIDHRIPISRGGGHEFSQLRTLCRMHNQQQFEARVSGPSLDPPAH
jgi:hypothetical protein